MMTNRQIAKTFQLLAKMMELHGENEFRIRAYRTAYESIRKLDRPLAEMAPDEIGKIKGIGTSTAEKIRELLTKGTMERFEQYAKKTPEGIRELLLIKGLGAGKVKTIWKEMGIETSGELLYACHENRLVDFSGFGIKTQAEIRKQLEYHLESEGKFLWAALEPITEQIGNALKGVLSGRMDWVGEFARKCPVVMKLECAVEGKLDPRSLIHIKDLSFTNKESPFECVYQEIYHFTLYAIPSSEYEKARLRLTGDESFNKAASKLRKFPDLPPELMEGGERIDFAKQGKYADLIQVSDIKGIVHCHSTYSDGLHSLEEMARFTKDAGFGYMVITEHSKSSAFARGLSVERVQQQWQEIDALNKALAPFVIFKGIESDILGDGSLDYDQDTLKGFDLIIASIHSGMQMDVTKATARLVKAIENPHTRILGHPTGRLLLARPGYPIDYRKVIDACAANGVAIELNGNPQRLDMDSAHLGAALEKGVLISINPDAHSMGSIHNIRFGVNAARRGGLPRSQCLTARSLGDFRKWVKRLR